MTMVVPPHRPLSYEMRFRLTWCDYLIWFLFPAGGAVSTIAGGPRILPATIAFAVLCVVAAVPRVGRLLLRVDGRGIELPDSGVFVAWPHVLDASIQHIDESTSLVFRVVRGSVVPLSARGERTARRANGPPRWDRSTADYPLFVTKSFLDRAALTAVIRAYAPHVTGPFGAG